MPKLDVYIIILVNELKTIICFPMDLQFCIKSFMIVWTYKTLEQYYQKTQNLYTVNLLQSL